MRRSRSLFDLSDAIGKAEALSPPPPMVREALPEAATGPLVAFERTPSAATARSHDDISGRSGLGPIPELAHWPGATAKLAALVAWLQQDPLVVEALVADDAGLAITHHGGSSAALLGAAGTMAHAVRRLNQTTRPSEFESHVGQSPVLSLIGIEANKQLYVVAMSRQRQPSVADVKEIRLAFRPVLEALGLVAVKSAGQTSQGEPA